MSNEMKLVYLIEELDPNSDFLKRVMGLNKYMFQSFNSIKAYTETTGKYVKPDLFIINHYVNSDFDGIGLCKAIKSNEDTKHIPVVIMAVQNEGVELNSVLAGADEFIHKPFDIDLTRVLIKRALGELPEL